MVIRITSSLNKGGYDMIMVFVNIRTRHDNEKYMRPITVKFTNELVKIDIY